MLSYRNTMLSCLFVVLLCRNTMLFCLFDMLLCLTLYLPGFCVKTLYNLSICNYIVSKHYAILPGAQWLSGRVLDSRPKGRGFEPHRRHCVVSLSKNINPSLVLVQPRKTRPFITERLLMGHKESNQTKNAILPIYNVIEFSIVHFSPDWRKWHSKTMFQVMFDRRSSIVKSVFDCHLSGVFKSRRLIIIHALAYCQIMYHDSSVL